MITIVIQDNDDGTYPFTKCREICTNIWSCKCAYAEGLVEPNYPVPAIRYEIEHERGHTFIWKRWMHDLFGNVRILVWHMPR